MGRFGMRPVLITTLAVCVTAVVAIGVLPLTVPMYMGVGFIAGLSTPPVQPAVRTIYPKMVNSGSSPRSSRSTRRPRRSSGWCGPVVTTFVATQVGTVWAILLAAAMMVVGGIWFISLARARTRAHPALEAALRRRVSAGRPSCSRRSSGSSSSARAPRSRPVSSPAFGHDGSEAGIVLAIFSVGSLAGGLFLGHVPIGPWATARRLFIVFVGVSLAAFAMDFWWLAVTLFIAGIGIAPALAVLFAIVSASVKFSDTAEAYGWVGTGQLIGRGTRARRSPGSSSTASAPRGRSWAAFRPGVPRRRRGRARAPWHPDLEVRDASPIPDTEPVPLQPS
jgi:MFS family permease